MSEAVIPPWRSPSRVRSVAVLAAAAWLVVAACGKALTLRSFSEALGDHGLVPRQLLLAATWGVPLLELGTGVSAVWLLLGGASARRAALPVLAMFGLLAGYALWLAIYPPAKPSSCGCGLSQVPIATWWPVAAKNLVVTAIIATCAFLPAGAGGALGGSKPDLG